MNIHPKSSEAYDLLHKGVLALSRAEQAGLRVDMEYLKREQRNQERKVQELEDVFKQSKFYRHWEHVVKGKVNIYSHVQLSSFLYKVNKLEPTKTTDSGQGATDEDAMKALNIPELDQLLEIRKYKKILEVLENFEREQVDGVLRPSYNLHLVRTFRSSCDSPNFQNIPNRDKEAKRIVRSAIFPRHGHQLVSFDFKGIEVGVNACINKDENLIHYIKDSTTDMHRDMAQQIFKIKSFNDAVPGHKVLRQAAKNGFVFPEFYGDYYKNCATSMACRWGELPEGKWKPGQGILLENEHLSDHLILKGLNSYEKFTEHVKSIEADFWGNRFVGYARWKKRWWEKYQKTGYIDLPTNFRCSGVMDRKKVCNYPGQGSAFHCLLWSFIEADRVMRVERWDTRLVGQIHDDIVMDVHPDELERVIKVTQRITSEDLPNAWRWIIVPMKVDVTICPVDGSWADRV